MSRLDILAPPIPSYSSGDPTHASYKGMIPAGGREKKKKEDGIRVFFGNIPFEFTMEDMVTLSKEAAPEKYVEFRFNMGADGNHRGTLTTCLLFVIVPVISFASDLFQNF